MAKLLRSCSLLLALVLFGCSTDTQEAADTIYSGGPILTIDDDQLIVEAVAVRDGRILAVGADCRRSRQTCSLHLMVR